MKVLAISSSPRKGGNSDILCDQFLKGAQEAGHETEKIRLSEKKISPCAACNGCAENHTCVKQDDMGEILEKMIASDIIVLATPVYFYCMDAQMKMMIDRCYSRYQEMVGKELYFMVTAADPQRKAAEETVAGLRGFLRCLPSAKESGVIYGTGAWDKGDIYRHPAYGQAYAMGRKTGGAK